MLTRISQHVHRPRRMRRNPLLRNLVHEVRLDVSQLIQPYFLSANPKARQPISNFTGVYRWGSETLFRKVESDLDRGLRSFLLFGTTESKDPVGTGAFAKDGLVPETLRALRTRFGQSALWFTDVCLCPYTSHGHCGVLEGDEIVNDKSVEQLCKMAIAHAQGGADFVAPSDMMDGRVGAIRKALDENAYSTVGILSYTAKYASSYYGPFREALWSSPQKMDRSSYQMDFGNRAEALRELKLDLAEGADIVMVKPALPYLDIIALYKEHSDVPVAAYSVSAEYEMVKALVAKGMAVESKMVIENLTAIRRAGALLIVTYYASEAAEMGWLR